MTLCINDSGTWRDITTQCINDSGTWRKVATGCINDSGTWRKFGFGPALGSAYEGGFLICCQPTCLRWVVAPSSSQVCRTWYNALGHAATRAQQVTGCTGWFLPNTNQLADIGYPCRAYWDSYSLDFYWSNEQRTNASGCGVNFITGTRDSSFKNSNRLARAFRCVTY